MDTSFCEDPRTPLRWRSTPSHLLVPPLAREAVLKIRDLPPERRARIERNNWLLGRARKLHSQSGEEGILDAILERIEARPGWCVEFGAFDGETDLNCWSLVNERGWPALLVEPMDAAFERLARRYGHRSDVVCLHGSVGWEGDDALDRLLARSGVPTRFPVLVIDIDGNDYHVWEALRAEPEVVIIEVNPLIPSGVSFVQPPDPSLHHQASLEAVFELGKRKGYELVCVTSTNAIFVRREHYPRFGIADNRPEAMVLAADVMQAFQLYDGTLVLAGQETLYWQSQRMADGAIRAVPIDPEDVQPLPKALRVHRPRHTYANRFLDGKAGRLDPASVPGNVLLRHRRSIASENGEDGILERIFDLVGTETKLCVDVGANDGRYLSNTWHLVEGLGWSGVLIEREGEAFAKLRERYANRNDVVCVHACADTAGPESLDEILAAAGVPASFDLLCLDVEGNEYHLFRSLAAHRPRVVVTDFNPSIPNRVEYVQAEGADVHHGSSLAALIALAAERGYELAAVTDWNAIFVDARLFPLVGLGANDIDAMYAPVCEMKAFQTMHGRLFLRGCTRLMRQDWEIDQSRIQVLPDDLMTVSTRFEDFGKQRTIFFPFPAEPR
jgi:hypothetical protein